MDRQPTLGSDQQRDPAGVSEDQRTPCVSEMKYSFHRDAIGLVKRNGGRKPSEDLMQPAFERRLRIGLNHSVCQVEQATPSLLDHAVSHDPTARVDP
jgi:hypothetical protein